MKLEERTFGTPCILTIFFLFFSTLGRGILRPLNTIYKCATRIYDESNYVGKLVPSLVNNFHCHHFMVEWLAV